MLKGLYPRSISGREVLNDLARLDLQGSSDDLLALPGSVATHVTATLRNDAQQRPLDALIAEIHRLPADATAEHYQLVLRPWLWWLTLASNNRVFQNLASSDIVTTIFKAHGFTDFKLSLTGSYEPREYCVQYGESDFAFVSRLLEEEGIFWFFTHEEGKHTLVLADSNDAFPPIPNGPKVPYLGQEIGVRELHGIRSARYCLQAVVGTYSATDYEFTTPSTSLYSQAQGEVGPRVQYEYPGGYTAKVRGDALAKQRVDGLRSQERRLIGESDCRWLVPGHWFTLTGHDDAALNIDWVLTSVTHEADHEHYRNRFEAIPKDSTYRPPRITPKPRMHTQIAKVVGKAGEEIWTDKYGRIKIQFPWDRDGKNDETASCWVRVALPWSGKGFGIQFVPRVGQEVIVAFIDGDPDKPLVTGCVYNGDNSMPYALPDNATQSGIKTNSSKGGDGFNELRFEDKKDEEQVFLQAQKDFAVNVLNDATVDIGHDQALTVTNDRTRTVKEGNDTTTVEKGDRSVTIAKGKDTLNVKDARNVTVEGDQHHNVQGNDEHTVKGDYKLTVEGNLTIEVSGKLMLNSRGDLSAKSNGNVMVEASGSLDNKAGASLTNKAGTSLENKAGTTLTNNAGATLTNKASASQTVDGGGMLTLKGGMIKAN